MVDQVRNIWIVGGLSSPKKGNNFHRTINLGDEKYNLSFSFLKKKMMSSILLGLEQISQLTQQQKSVNNFAEVRWT